MTVVMSKISKQDKLDTINFFFEKQGKRLSSKSLTGKVMDQIIGKYNIDSYIYNQMVSQRGIEKEKKEKARAEDDKRFKEKMMIEKEKDKQDKQDFENLPKMLKKLCEKKYRVEEYMGQLKNKHYEINFIKKLVADAFKSGGKPERCFINEDGSSATINGIQVHHSMGSIGDDFCGEIYQEKYIKD